MRRLGVVLVGIALSVSCVSAPAFASPPGTGDPTAWAVDGATASILANGSTAYIAGRFNRVGPPSGSALVFNSATSAPASFPHFAGGIADAAVSDGAGGWFVGGDFDRVAGSPRYGLAHVRADGSVDTAFPQVAHQPLYTENVASLLLSGTTLYVGGSFTQIGGQSRKGLAAISTTTDTVTSWAPQLGGSFPSVNTMALGTGTTAGSVFIGGDFTGVGAVTASDVAKVSTSTGAADSAFKPVPSAGGHPDSAIIYALAVSTTGSSLYVGGYFDTIGGQSRNDLGRVATTGGSDGQAEAWNPNPDDEVFAIQVQPGGGTVFVAGVFSHVGGKTRGAIAALSSGTGNATSWNVGLSSVEVTSIVVSGPDLLLVGDFDSIAGQPRRGVALVNYSTAALEPFNPDIRGELLFGAAGGSQALLGGISVIGAGSDRAEVAQLDAYGHPTGFNVQVVGTVQALALSADRKTLYLGGSFTTIDGQPRLDLAAVDATTGALKPWQSGATGGYVSTIALSGDGGTLFVGGAFTQLGSDHQPRVNIGAVSTTDGHATGWSPVVTGGFVVSALKLSPDANTVYAGGVFSTADGQPRSNLAAFAATGAGPLSAWAPNPHGGVGPGVDTLAVAANGTVYVGGTFTTVGSNAAARSDLAAISPAGTGAASAWNPGVSTSDAGNPAEVRALALSADGTSIYAGGRFQTIGGQPRIDLAELSLTTGGASGWNPDPGPYSGSVDAVAVDGGSVRIGGGFSRVGNDDFQGYAQFTSPPANTVRPTLSGTAAKGDRLTCHPGSFSNSPLLLAYAWTRDGRTIKGRTSTTYTVVGSDSGHALACVVTAINARGSATASSASKTPGPYISSFSLTRSRISLDALPAWLRPVVLSARARRKYYFKFTITERAKVTITIERLDTGVKSRGKCRPRARHRHGKPCTLHVKIGTLTIKNAHAGSNKLRLRRRVGRRRLAKAHYDAVISARDSHKHASNKKTIKFRIV